MPRCCVRFVDRACFGEGRPLRTLHHAPLKEIPHGPENSDIRHLRIGQSRAAG